MKNLIIDAITGLMGFDGNEIFQRSRKQKYVLARQMTFYYLRHELFWTQTKIGEFFEVDHATVIFGIKSFNSRIEIYHEEKDLYAKYRAVLNHGKIDEKELLSAFITKNKKHLSENLKQYLTAAI